MARFEFRILIDDKGVSDEEMVDMGLAAIRAAIAMNLLHLRRHPEDVCILGCGKIKYDTKNKSVLLMISEISTIPILAKKRKGLCIDIVAADVAIKIFEGLDVWPHIFFTGGGIFHVVTQGYGQDGRVLEYDPSAELEQQGLVVSYQPDSCKPCRV